MTRSWAATTLADTFGVTLADEQDCYAAMDCKRSVKRGIAYFVTSFLFFGRATGSAITI